MQGKPLKLVILWLRGMITGIFYSVVVWFDEIPNKLNSTLS